MSVNQLRQYLSFSFAVFLFASVDMFAQAPAKTPSPAAPTAASPAKAAQPAPAPTPAQAAAAAKNAQALAAQAANDYNIALNDYYHTQFVSNLGFIKGTIKYYRRTTKKMDAKYNFLETPEFEKQAEMLFEEQWKAKARKKLTIQELQYLITYEKSNLRKKLSDLEREATGPEPLAEVFDPVVEKMLKAGSK